MNFGLSKQNINDLVAVFKKYLQQGQVIVYGSRVKGTFTDRSDIDLVIKNSNNIDEQLISNIKSTIEESDFPYLVDLQFYETIKNTKLLEHIDRVGKVLFE